MEVTVDTISNLSLEEALQALPPRYIHHPFDQLYELVIYKETTTLGQEWYVMYKRNKSTDMSQRQNTHLILAIKEKLKDLLDLGIKLYIK